MVNILPQKEFFCIIYTHYNWLVNTSPNRAENRLKFWFFGQLYATFRNPYTTIDLSSANLLVLFPSYQPSTGRVQRASFLPRLKTDRTWSTQNCPGIHFMVKICKYLSSTAATRHRPGGAILFENRQYIQHWLPIALVERRNQDVGGGLSSSRHGTTR